jgi:hypothetical protein
MRVLVAAASMLLVALSATACGTDSGDTAQDPGSSAPPMPTAIPPADGPVVGLGLVLDASSEGEPGFCLGPVAESYPPQCTGLPMTGWSWAEHRGDFDNAGGVRFGTFAVTGGFDGTTVTYEAAVAGAVYDPMPWPQPTSSAAGDHSAAELEAIGRELQELPGALSTMPGDNLVVVDVVHDDGSLQDWADAAYGDGLVFVHSALAPAA